jgi:hypothetical protein
MASLFHLLHSLVPPQAVLTEKRNRYQRGNKAIHRAELLNESDSTIIATYQLEYRGIANYSHCSSNLGVLNLSGRGFLNEVMRLLVAERTLDVSALVPADVKAWGAFWA